MKAKPTDTKPATFAVTLEPGARPGLVSCGAYHPGREYAVNAEEAVRLVDLKGFRFVQPADEAKARAAAKAAEPAAATAAGE